MITALVILFNMPIMSTLWRYSFDDGTYSHAFLVPFIVGYLFYLLAKNNDLNIRDKLNFTAVIVFLLSCYILLVTSSAQISLLYWLATLLLLCSAINLVFKTKFKIFFPTLYFIFLIPVWGLLTIPLQDISVTAVTFIMSFTSIPVFVEDQFVHIPSGIFEIAGGCSGLRYLLTSLAISSLFIFLYLRTIKNIFIFAFVAILGALLTNWLRIAILIIIGHQTEMTSNLMNDHNMFGWYLYIPFMLLLFKLGGYLSDQEASTSHTTEKTSKTNKLNWKVTAVLFAGLLLSSTSLTMSNTAIPLPVNVKIYPLVYYFSSVDIVKDDAKVTHLIYSFNGKSLEGKPTFFDNNLIPDGWLVESENRTYEKQTFKVKKGLNTAVINISYEITNKKIGNVSLFKFERLKQALIGTRETKLHWKFQLD